MNSKNNFKFYLHIGLPKTATTFFQRIIFPNLKNTFFLGRNNKKGYEELNNRQRQMEELVLYLVKAEELDFNINYIKKRLDLKKIKKKKILLSYEDFSMNRTTKFYRGYLGERLCDRKIILERLEKTFFKPFFIITIRSYRSCLKSYFYFLIKHNQTGINVQKWFEANKKVGGALSMFKIGELIDFLKKQFGSKRVLVIQYEHLRDEPSLIFNKLGKYMKEDFSKFSPIAKKHFINQRLSKEKVIFLQKNQNLRLLNSNRILRFFEKPFLNINKEFKKIDKEIDKNIDKHIGFFKDDFETLKKNKDLTLDEYII